MEKQFRVTVKIDRPIGSRHPKYPELIYPINYGYVEGVMGGDGMEQDAYVIGVDYAISSFSGVVVAIIHRRNDVEDKWVVAPTGSVFSKSEIADLVNFQEKYFDSEIILLNQER